MEKNMSVKLVALSKPSTSTDCDTAEELIAFVARVSNKDNQNNKATAAKLVKYLINNDHWSPLEMVHVTMEIETTRDIARQILRHRSFSFQEFSQRYAEVQQFTTTREARLQDPKNRQNSIYPDNDEVIPLTIAFERMQREVAMLATETYRKALDMGIAKEQARALLPEGLTMSTMYMAGSLRSWIHYIVLRAENGTQKEHKLIALQCWDIIKQHFPSVASVLAEQYDYLNQ
jgi:thymidylate synthase (FAD)